MLSLFSECIANEKPLYVHYQGSSFFPVLFFYPGTSFGQEQSSEAHYRKLLRQESFLKEAFVVRAMYPYGPYESYLHYEAAPPHLPSKQHWLGTDRLGRDVLARLLYGLRTSLLFAFSLAALMTVLGVIIGGLQGYYGSWLDLSMQRLIEIWSALPFLYVVIFMASLYGRSFAILVLVIALFNWIGLSYYMRAEFLKEKKKLYVEAARALGFSKARIFMRHILPNSLSPLLSILPFAVISGISVLTALDFLGFGLQPPTASWGELLKQGLGVIREFPHLTLITSSVLFFTLLLVTFIGEGLREALDPHALSKS